MKNKDLADLLEVTPVQITEKLRSTNRITAIMTKLLLTLDKDDLGSDMEEVNEWWKSVESDRMKRKNEAKKRAEKIKSK